MSTGHGTRARLAGIPAFPQTLTAFCIAIALAGCSMTGGTKDEAQPAAQPLQGIPAAGIEGVSAEQIQSATAAQPSQAAGQYTGVGGVSIPVVAAPTGAAFDDTNAAHHLARCREHVGRGEWFDAAASCKRAADLAPDSPDPHSELMRIYVTIQSFRDAAASAERVIEMQPQNAVAYYYLGWARREREEHPQAIEALEKAVTLAPARHEFVQALGLAYCSADDFGRGLARLEQAAAMNPGDAKGQRLLESARALVGDKLAPYRRAVAEKPEKPESHARLGSVLQKYGMAEQALAAYDSALAKIPEPLADKPAETRRLAAGLYYNRGVLYRELKRGELALPAFQRAYEIDASLAPEAYYSIGLVRLDQGDASGAVASLMKSVELAPNVVENRQALARALEAAGRAGEAKAQLDAAAGIRASQAPPPAPEPAAQETPPAQEAPASEEAAAAQQ